MPFVGGRERRGYCMEKKHCEFCHKEFLPNPRTTRIQRSCSSPGCKKKRAASAIKDWRKRNPEYEKSRRPKINAWARSYPAYWREYRKKHPDYAEKDNLGRGIRKRKQKSSAKQNTILQSFLERFKNIKNLGTESSAKQNTIPSHINLILDYLLWRDCSAKQDAIALAVPFG